MDREAGLLVVIEIEAATGSHSVILQNVCQMYPSPDGKTIFFEMVDGTTKNLKADYKLLMQRLRKHSYVSVS